MPLQFLTPQDYTEGTLCNIDVLDTMEQKGINISENLGTAIAGLHAVHAEKTNVAKKMNDFYWGMPQAEAEEILRQMGFEKKTEQLEQKSIECLEQVWHNPQTNIEATASMQGNDPENRKAFVYFNGIINSFDCEIMPCGCSRSPENVDTGDAYFRFSYGADEPGTRKVIEKLGRHTSINSPIRTPAHEKTCIKTKSDAVNGDGKYLTLKNEEIWQSYDLVVRLQKLDYTNIKQQNPFILTTSRAGITRYWWQDKNMKGRWHSCVGTKEQAQKMKSEIEELSDFTMQHLQKTAEKLVQIERSPSEYQNSKKLCLKFTTTGEEYSKYMKIRKRNGEIEIIDYCLE